jgi:ABC-type multidrug transport system fused ATPase/permease subunit
MVLKQNKFLLIVLLFVFARTAGGQEINKVEVLQEEAFQENLLIDSNIQTVNSVDIYKELNKDKIDSNLNQEVWQEVSNELEYSEDVKKEKNKEKKVNKKKEKKSSKFDFSELRYLFLILGIILLGVLIFLILKNSSFRRNTKVSINYEIEELHPEEVSHDELDELLRKAIQSNNPRLSFRFSYLKLLKNLVEIQEINYKKNKSNYDYIKEINQREIKELFKEITIVFDYVWYGQKEYTLNEWERSKVVFNQLNELITNERQ